MKQFFILFFNKTFLIYIALHITSHIVYPYLYDFPYLFAIKIAMLIITIAELIGMVLYNKASHKLQKRLSLTVNSRIKDSYQTIEILSACFFFIYCFIPRRYIMPNYIMILLFGGYIGFRLAIRANQYLNKEKSKNG